MSCLFIMVTVAILAQGKQWGECSTQAYFVLLEPRNRSTRERLSKKERRRLGFLILVLCSRSTGSCFLGVMCLRVQNFVQVLFFEKAQRHVLQGRYHIVRGLTFREAKMNSKCSNSSEWIGKNWKRFSNAYWYCSLEMRLQPNTSESKSWFPFHSLRADWTKWEVVLVRKVNSIWCIVRCCSIEEWCFATLLVLTVVRCYATDSCLLAELCWWCENRIPRASV